MVKARRKKAAPGIRVIDRDGVWHISGTLRAAGRKKRVRKSAELPATPENRDAAEKIRLDIERGFRDEVVHGKRQSVPIAVAIEAFLNRQDKKPLGPTEIAILKELDRVFAGRVLADISDKEWNAYVDQRMAGNSRSTRERYLNAVVSFLNWSRGKKRRWITEVPEFDRENELRSPKHRRARRVADLTPELILLLIEHAPPHLVGPIAAMWATGGRVSMILYHCRLCDYIAADGREQLTYQDSKNGDPVTASLHPEAARLMRRYLDWRGKLWDREAPLFLTDERVPYTDNRRAGGGQMKSAWAGMKRRTIRALRWQGAQSAKEWRRSGDNARAIETIAWTKDKCALVQQITPHWFRHNLATKMLSLGADPRAVMEQGGWRSMNVMIGYAHDVPERRRAIVDRLGEGVLGNKNAAH
ncbi:MAG: tyrosine-type recombinase/integrase [Alphaproteobacteria bacterium]|nr:tyrosine-type recombinase/integrase [Alphaproteobacteria bacterium]